MKGENLRCQWCGATDGRRHVMSIATNCGSFTANARDELYRGESMSAVPPEEFLGWDGVTQVECPLAQANRLSWAEETARLRKGSDSLNVRL